MFFIGSNVMNWPLEAQRAMTDGEHLQWLLREFDCSNDIQDTKFAFVSGPFIFHITIDNDNYSKIHGRIGIVRFCISITREVI